MVVGLAATGMAQGSDISQVGRDVVERHKDSLVTVRTLIRQTVGGRTGESRTETAGTIVDETGLTVISLSAIDPSAIVKQMYAGRLPPGQEVSAEVADIQMVLADQTEVNAEVVIRDSDLDLAVIRPTEKIKGPVRPVDLGGKTKAQLLDEVIVVTRLGQVANRMVGASVVHIGAVVEKPRLFYILGETTQFANLGALVFTATGEFLGMLVVRTGPADVSGGRGSMLGIVIPAASIKENVDQAKEAPKK